MQDLAEIRKSLNDNPGDPRALRGAANFYLDESCYKQAQACFSQAAAYNPHLLPSILLDYEAKIAADPDKIGPRLSLAGFFLLVDEADAAILELEEILDHVPQNAETYNALGRIFIKQNRIDEAIVLLERSIENGVKDVRLTETLAGAYLEKGRVGDAIKFYEEIASHPDRDGQKDKQVLRILGELYTRGEDYDRAADKYAAMFSDDPEVVREVTQHLEEMLKKVEGNIKVREILADIYAKTLNPDAAVEKIREVLRLESTKLADAIQRLRLILKNYPNHPPASLALAEALRRQGNYSEAAEGYQALVKIKPEFIEEVIQGFRELLAACPEQVLARAYLGEALLNQNKIPEALAEFGKMIEYDPSVADLVTRKCREILRLDPQRLSVHVVLGQAYLAKQDFQRAAIEAEGVIALDKNFTAAYLLQGEAYFKLNLPRKASQALHTALVLAPFDAQIHDKYRRVREKELDMEIEVQIDRLELAKMHLQKGERDPAVRELQLAAKNPANAAAAYNLLGNIHRSEGRYDLAAAQYNRGLETASPELSKLLRFNLGATYESQGLVRKAIKLYEEVLQVDIDFGGLKQRSKQLKGSSLLSMRNRPLQIVICEYGKNEIIALWGREIRPGGRPGGKEEVSVSFGQEHNQAGFDLFIKGMFTAAEEEFSLAVQLDREFGEALNNLGVAQAKAGKLEEAKQRLTEALQIHPASSVYCSNLGVIYFLLGKADPALAYLEKSFALNSESAALCLNLGDAYYFRGQSQQAIELYRRVGQFDPLSDLAGQRLLYKVP